MALPRTAVAIRFTLGRRMHSGCTTCTEPKGDSQMEDRTQGSFAVVTGASSGIGLELAKQFAQHGFDLLIVADNPEIVKAADTLRGYGVSVTERQIDLTKPEGVERFYEQIQSAAR